MLTEKEKGMVKDLQSQGYNQEQIAGYLGGLRANAPSSVSVQLNERPKEPDEGVISRIIKDAPSDVIETFKQGGEGLYKTGRDIVDTAKRDDMSLVNKVVTGGAQFYKGIGRFLGETFLGAAKVATTDEFEKKAAAGIGEGAQMVMESNTAQSVMKWFGDLDPVIQQQIKNIMGYGEFITEVVGIGKAFRLIGHGTEASTQALKSTGKQMVEEIVSASRRGDTNKTLRLANAAAGQLDSTTGDKMITKLSDVYHKSLVENRKTINRKLDELAVENSYGKKQYTRDSLIRDLAAEGYIPEVEGRIARFQHVFDDIDARQSRVMKALEPVLETSNKKVSTNALYELVNQALIDNKQIIGGLSRSQAELERLFQSYRQKFGDTLTATQVNEIRKEANALTRAFKDDKFSADTASEMGRVTRRWLDDNIPDESVRKANAEWARLNRLRDTADVFNYEQIDVGLFGRALGSYVTTVAASGIGLSAGGPGGLVIASLIAKMGGDKLADMLRKKYFDPEATKLIQAYVRNDDELIKQLQRTSTEQSIQTIVGDAAKAAGDAVDANTRPITAIDVPEQLVQEAKVLGFTDDQIKAVADGTKEILDKAPASKNYVDSIINQTVDEVADTVPALAPLKGADRIMEKTLKENGGDITKLQDAARGTVVVKTRDARDAVKQAFDARDDVVSGTGYGTRGRVQSPEKFSGYGGVIYNVKTPNGLIAEIQVVEPHMIYGKSPEADAVKILGQDLYDTIKSKTGMEPGVGHQLYEDMRKMTVKEGPEWDALEAQSQEYYRQLTEKFAGTQN